MGGILTPLWMCESQDGFLFLKGNVMQVTDTTVQDTVRDTCILIGSVA